MDDIWSVIDGLRSKEIYTLNDIMQFDKKISTLITGLCIGSADSPQKELSIACKHYRFKQRQLLRLKNFIELKRKNVQDNCEHNWERDLNDPDDRSHYDCKKCDAWR